jgi:endogenous inhibitor of DNA gyrase (YacG/DUF329 family)
MDNQSKPKQVKCPQCGRLALYSSENKFRPFCSERCRIIDLGAWADESYRIPAKDSSSDALTSSDLHGDEFDDDNNNEH